MKRNDIESIALKSISELEQTLGQPEGRAVRGRRNRVRGQVARTLAGDTENVHEAAVHAKATAVWKVSEDMNQHYLLQHIQAVVTVLEETYPGMMVSALDIIEVVNQCAHRAHNHLVEQGWSFADLCRNYTCEPEVIGELYQVALPQADDTFAAGFLSEVARTKFDNAEALVRFVLEKYATHYAARHIVQQYEALGSGEA